MKRFILIILFVFVSFVSYSQKLYEGTSTFESGVICNVQNGYVYKKTSTMSQDLIYYFDGTYLYKLNGSKSHTTNDIVLTYNNGKFYCGKSTMHYDLVCIWYKNRLYGAQSMYESDILFTYSNNKIYLGNSTMHNNIIYNTSGYIHPAILVVMISL